MAFSLTLGWQSGAVSAGQLHGAEWPEGAFLESASQGTRLVPESMSHE